MTQLINTLREEILEFKSNEKKQFGFCEYVVLAGVASGVFLLVVELFS